MQALISPVNVYFE